MITYTQIIDFLGKKYRLFPHSSKEDRTEFLTVCHGGDSHNLKLFKRDKYFVCFTNCGRMSLFDLIQKLEACRFREALGIVCDFFDIAENEFTPQESSIEEKLQAAINEPLFPEFKSYERNLPELVCPSFNAPQWYQKKYYAGWIKEGITVPVMEAYNIRWCAPYNYIIIPHYDECGRLVGVRRRALNPEDIKYKPIYGYEHHLGANLYGANLFPKDNPAFSGYAYLVESEKSVLQGASFLGANNVLATCGLNNVSPIQIDIMWKLGIRRVCLAFDNDVNWSDWTSPDTLLFGRKLKTHADRIRAEGMDVEIIGDWEGNLLDKKDSPFDKNKEVFFQLLEKKRSYEGFVRMIESMKLFQTRP